MVQELDHKLAHSVNPVRVGAGSPFASPPLQSASKRLFHFFFNDTATTEIYTLSLHDALPIWASCSITRATASRSSGFNPSWFAVPPIMRDGEDRKSTRLNCSHQAISYAV